MKYLKTTILVIASVFASCSREVIPDNEMPQIIAEIYKADRYLISDYTLALSTDTTKVYETVLKKHGYTTQDFRNTIEHYLPRPSKLKEFYAEALVLVTEELESVNSLIDERNRREIFAKELIRITSDTNALAFKDLRIRSIRWIARPDKFPEWRFTYNDSINNLYQTPVTPGWWNMNLQKDTFRYKYIMNIYEKNSRTIPVSRKLEKSFKKRVAGGR